MNKIIKSSMLKFKNQKDALLAIWSSGNAFVSGSGGSNLGWSNPTQGCQRLATVTNSKRAVLPTGAMMRIWASPTLYPLRRNSEYNKRFDFKKSIFSAQHRISQQNNQIFEIFGTPRFCFHSFSNRQTFTQHNFLASMKKLCQLIFL